MNTINFGSGSSIIEFAGVGAHTPTTGPDLLITNWSGNPDFGGGTHQLLFAGLASTFIGEFSQSDVTFNGVTGYNIYQFSGFYEVTAVPEPRTWFAAALALGAIAFSQRKRLRGMLKTLQDYKDYPPGRRPLWAGGGQQDHESF